MEKVSDGYFFGHRCRLKNKTRCFSMRVCFFCVGSSFESEFAKKKRKKLLLENIAGTLKPKHCRSKQKESNMHCKQQNMACSLHTKSKPQKAEAWNTKEQKPTKIAR